MTDKDQTQTAFVGVAFKQQIIFNVLDTYEEFGRTGVDIINALKSNTNKFVSCIIESQNFESINEIRSNEFRMGIPYNRTDSNRNDCSFVELYRLMENESDTDYYIYDYFNDVLIVKEQSLSKIVAIDYKSDTDVQAFINNLII